MANGGTIARLVLGGSFNPIHHGHLACSRGVAEALGFDRITLIPTHHPPHKPEAATLADSVHRLSMVRLAVANDALFEVDDIELTRSGPSFTLDTATELIARGQGPVNWLIGADMLLYLPNWHRAVELVRTINFVIMARPGWSIDWALLPSDFRQLQANVVEVPLLSISSTDLRARVAAGRSIRYLTPDAVCTYIQEHRLYEK